MAREWNMENTVTSTDSNHTVIDAEDEGINPSTNTPFAEVLNARLSRRDTLRAGLGLSSVAFASPLALTACGEGGRLEGQPRLGFTSIAPFKGDAVRVPEGYSARVLYAFGDPLTSSVPAFKNDGTDDPATYVDRAGTGHDGMHYFPLPGFDSDNSDNGLLVMNHENVFILGAMHENGGPTVDESGNRTELGEVVREMSAHGVSVVEISRATGRLEVVQDSVFNRRITARTEMRIAGPVGGSEFVQTAFSPDGTRTRGTLNNCAMGYTPWGTYLTCEENWHGYFKTDEATPPATKTRYGVNADTNYAWETAAEDSLYTRFDTTPTGANASEDFRNEANGFGWVVEIDPYDPTSTPVKRTALGRFKHEGCWPSRAIPGQPLAFYSGDDERGEYIYKFVTAQAYRPGLSNGSILDEGTLYVARFDANGTGEWLELSMDNPILAANFSSLAELLVNTRAAADLVGATPMDRPEWGAVNPANGEVYMTLTNNRNRGQAGQEPVDAANPRNYQADDDPQLEGNHNGHIIRWREFGDDPAATGFQWDIFLFGAPADADPDSVNISNLDETNAFASPDGLWFDPRSERGLLWIQTDDGSIRDFTNNQLLAAIPGRVGDGQELQIDGQQTFVGQQLGADALRRFMVGPAGCEVTGIATTPDGKTMFINIQHPGGELPRLELSNNWPIAEDATVDSPASEGEIARPRPATIVITRDDGGVIGQD